MRQRAMQVWACLNSQREGVMMYRRGAWFHGGVIGARGDSTGWPRAAGLALFPFLLPNTAHRISLKRLAETEDPQGGVGGSSYVVDAIVHKGHGDGLLFGPLNLPDHRSGAESMGERVKQAEQRGYAEIEPNRNMISVCSANADIWELIWPEWRGSPKNWLVFRLGVKVFDDLFAPADSPGGEVSRWGGVGSFHPEVIKAHAETMGDDYANSNFNLSMRASAHSGDRDKHLALIASMDIKDRRRLCI